MHNIVNRWLKESCNISPVKLQLAELDIAGDVVVACPAELDKLWLVISLESELGGLLENVHYVIDIIRKIGVFKEP